MILIDGRVGSKELLPYIKKLGIPCELTHLEYGDVCFAGKGPKGEITIGVELKRLHDMLGCIDDSRYSAHQRPGMMQMYDKSFLMVEGHWRNHEEGWLMEGFQGGASWGFCKYRTSRVMYSKLYRYLLSVGFSGVTVLYSRDIVQTAYNIGEVYHWFSKKWENHTSLIDVQKLAIPAMDMQASLVRKAAAQITDVGAKFSLHAEKIFRNLHRLANSSEQDWMKIPRLGIGTAQQIVREINTNRTK